MKSLGTLLFLLLCIKTSTLFAHALWIETDPIGKVGQKHETNIFYGEYAEGIKEDTSNWYSDMETFSIWLVDDRNNKTLLKTETFRNSYATSFTPSRNGVYTVLIQHGTKDFPGNTRYEFISSAVVVVGEIKKSNPIPQNTNNISLSTDVFASPSRHKSFTIQALVNGKPSKDLKFEVVSETGWAKKIGADANGNLTFVPIWNGKYLIEAMQTEKVEGTFAGKNFTSVWRVATYMIEVK